ncbi:MAG: phosphonate C-P lyase system protein PhnL [Litorivicinaceae bacterium]|jgi:alpha-D-ribose 1-methylphosphonate 5-triphosphate synthase subunit PhnL|nr:phosphonate C-P lyase system protein PhnL [Litorivicinaceae bacterium]MDP5330531.1 phosphonate C-P lyase system protein PhnL [Litorivicinaceae bacterium]MDP5340354.1 phosphonate C-P lyase system protein PhnL [Litorivicinaceae bacterium]MDP5341990.1 phosphonate C-P lyase system protein PhnL [Litorivicinaceae bacterium]
MSLIDVRSVSKTFILHNQGGVQLPVLRNASFQVTAGECVVLDGPSGTGKSTLLKMLYGNYRADSGQILVQTASGIEDLVAIHPHRMLQIRRDTVGFVSQFLRVIPRVSTWDVVCEPLRRQGADESIVAERARQLLQRLNLPQSLWSLAPATFSGGEQQRVNIARSLMVEYPILLLDEPTASLDAANREVVARLIEEARQRGAAVVGIFHDDGLRSRLADRLYALESAQ